MRFSVTAGADIRAPCASFFSIASEWPPAPISNLSSDWTSNLAANTGAVDWRHQHLHPQQNPGTSNHRRANPILSTSVPPPSCLNASKQIQQNGIARTDTRLSACNPTHNTTRRILRERGCARIPGPTQCPSRRSSNIHSTTTSTIPRNVSPR